MKDWFIVILAVVTAVFVIIPFIISVIVYEAIFGHHFSAYEPMAYSRSDFPNLAFKRYELKSKQGKKLVGYSYYADAPAQKEYKAVIIIAHGIGGGGHINYLDAINFFAENGFLVFGYDATGNDESEGRSARGLPQGAADLENAISFVESNTDFNGLPVLLFGHSWGGYSVGAALKSHPEVKAVVSLAGFNRTCDIIEAQGVELTGKTAKFFVPYITFYERLKFGKCSANTCAEGFASSDAQIMIIHSMDDTSVPPETGILQYEKEFTNSERFVFIRLKNKNHNFVYHTDGAKQYAEVFLRQLTEHISALKNGKKDGSAPVSRNGLKEEKAAYIRENFDKARAHELNAELFAQILAFYEKSIDSQSNLSD